MIFFSFWHNEVVWNTGNSKESCITWMCQPTALEQPEAESQDSHSSNAHSGTAYPSFCSALALKGRLLLMTLKKNNWVSSAVEQTDPHPWKFTGNVESGPSSIQGTSRPPRWSFQCVPSFLGLDWCRGTGYTYIPMPWPDLWPCSTCYFELPWTCQVAFLRSSWSVSVSWTEVPGFWQKVSLQVRHRENVSTAQQITGIFYRKKKMLFTLPTESRLSLLLGEECLYFHGKRERLWRWAEGVFRCFVI